MSLDKIRVKEETLNGGEKYFQLLSLSLLHPFSSSFELFYGYQLLSCLH